MIRLVVTIKLKEGKKDEYLKIVQEMYRETRKEKGCMEYHCCETENPELLYFIELWENEETLENHINSEHFKKFVPLLNQLKSQPSIFEKYNY
ncbi:MAG: antibiotic biosynthesis monooxygenase [Cetobacterium sp.]|nr:antibiotic biosynthesis monooxygenase [Cetobacterium sp.]